MLAHSSLSSSWFVVASAACVYETGLLRVCKCRTSAASVEPFPRGSRAVALPRWLQVLSRSTWLIVILIVRCCLGGLCVRDGLAASVCVYRTSAASVELRGWRAVAFPRHWLHDQSGSTWLIVILMVRCCFGGLCVYETGLLLVWCLRMSHFCCFR